MTDVPRAWICVVCGYIHRGSEPPESCPVCGAPQDAFEPHRDTAPAAPGAQTAQWRCIICNYVHDGPEPPVECPVCGASADQFEPVQAQQETTGKAESAPRTVILGGGIAGTAAAEAVRESAPDAEITLISAEKGLPYYRLNLSRYLAGEIGEDVLPIHPASWYEDQRIQLRSDVKAEEILADEREVRLHDGERVPFEKLILACGAHPFVPPIPGASRDGVHVFRTVDDARVLIDAAKPGARCLCIGGGILGLETAGGLARRGASVVVLESFEWLLPRQLNRGAGLLLEQYVAERGIAVRRAAKVIEIFGDARVSGVLLEGNERIPADFVVITAGVRSNTHLARKAGLDVNQGIVVDNHLRTSHPDILAAGDAAEHGGTVYGLWEPARYQGVIAGHNAAGLSTEFGGLPRANTLKVLDIDLFSIGVVTPQDGSYDVVAEESEERYSRFVFHQNRLVGAIQLGDTRLAAAITKSIKGGTDFSGLLQRRPTAAAVRLHLMGGES